MSRNLLNGENAIYVLPSLAKEIGLKNAIVLSFIEDVGPVGTIKIERNLGFMSRATIQRSLTELEELGLLKDVSYTDPYEIKEKVISIEDVDKKVCEWCGSKSITLHEHHFPIPRRNRGAETVNICPNCHYGYHHLETRRVSSTSREEEVLSFDGKKGP